MGVFSEATERPSNPAMQSALLPIENRKSKIKNPLPGLLVALATFLALAPTLRWMDFSSGSENLNVATALEIRRTGRWLIPTLQGQPRLAKPPLTAWITASFIRQQTLREISSSDPVVRARGYDNLAWDVRWPAALMAALSVLAVYELGRIVGGSRLGLVAAVIWASNYAVLRFYRNPTTDVTLSLWVLVANLFLARAILEGRRWSGSIGAGLAIGLSFMSKGPVGLVQTLLPAAVFVIWRAIGERGEWGNGRMGERGNGRGGEGERGREEDKETSDAGNWQLATSSIENRESKIENSLDSALSTQHSALSSLGPIALATLLVLAVGLPWYGLVIARWETGMLPAPAIETPGFVQALGRVFGKEDLWRLWYSEVSREGARDAEGNKWYSYISFLPMMLPWIVCFIGGLGMGIARLWKRDLDRATRQRWVYVLMLVLVPVLVMSLARDRKERYLLPMFGPGAILAAWGIMTYMANWARRQPLDALAGTIHWGIVMVAGVVFPLAGASGWIGAMRTIDGQPWFPPHLGLGAALLAAGAITWGVRRERQRPMAIAWATVAAMAITQGLFAYGYARSAAGRSELRPVAEGVWERFGGTEVYAYMPGRHLPQDLSIYLNRPVRLVGEVEQIAPPGRAQVLVVHQRKKEPPPVLPAEWVSFGFSEGVKSVWHAYYRRPRN